jgi:DNA mismatch repair protein MutL
MAKIHILDSSLINKIAAGEVIERPASVVKELIENSIDANANTIVIELKQGGKSLIKVIDNGSGMSEDDAKLCFKRHATSKINKIEDLFNITTLGFRGEALASIAAVSNLKITTKTKDSSEGYFAEIHCGKLIKDKKIGCAQGTIVEVDDLFLNTPAREKYLKDVTYELNHTIDIVTRYALINNNISFKLLHNNKIILNSPMSNSLLDNIITIYGKETAKQLLELKYYKNNIKINGFISKPSLTRSDKIQQSIFVNNRYIKNNIITNAVYDAYKTLLFVNRHPIFVLMIHIDPKKIDVNVHPAKKIIRLSQEDMIYKNVFEAIMRTLQNYNLIPDVKIEVSSAKPTKKYPFTQDKQSLLMVRESIAKEKSKSLILETKKIGPYLIVGQINKTYILVENKKGLLIIDQHAAQERILYEEFVERYKNNTVKKQNLIRAQVIELSPGESNLLRNNINLFSKLGFDIEEYGNNSFLVRAVPYIFDKFSKNLLIDIINELNSIKLKTVEELKEERIIRFACRKAIKAGLELTKPLMEDLINKLERTKQPYTCPHGRPTMINISLAELERKFKRVVS